MGKRVATWFLVVGIIVSAVAPAAAAWRTKPPVQRIMYWYGKVNQHVDVRTRQWVTDPDGVSGADIDMLQYCQRWYPETHSVRPYRMETIRTWRERGNVNAHAATMQSYECVSRR